MRFPVFEFHAGGIHGPYRTAEIYGQPSGEDISELSRVGVDGLIVLPERRSRGVLELGALERLKLRFLQVQTRRLIGPLPEGLLSSLEVLWLDGRLAEPVVSFSIERINSLSIPASSIVGHLSALRRIEFLGLEAIVTSGRLDLARIPSLRRLRLDFKKSVGGVVPGLDLDGSEGIEEVDIEGAAVSSFDCFRPLHGLRRLSVQPPHAQWSERTVSLAPLAECRKLEELLVADCGQIGDAEVLGSLPALQRVTAHRGAFSPWPGKQEWLVEV